MIYITDADLSDSSYKRFITESIGDTEDEHSVTDANELKAIGLAKTYMTGRYDTDKIFLEGAPIRDELLAEIIAKITLYKIFSRNAARKVSTDIKEDYQWAMKELQRINSGQTVLAGLPIPVDEDGASTSTGIHGNNKNEDFYI